MLICKPFPDIPVQMYHLPVCIK